MREIRRDVAGALVLAALLPAGALALKLYERGREAATSGLGWLISSDWVHVPAHLLLYGGLAACCARVFGGRHWPVILAVAGVALAQEACQSLAFGRAMGRAEVFDLLVDALALGAVLLASALQPQRNVA